MTGPEIHEILIKELAGTDRTHVGIMNAYHKICLNILTKWFKDSGDPLLRQMLQDTAYAKSRLCLLLTLKDDEPLPEKIVTPEIFKDILFVHKQWLAILKYFFDNYNLLDAEHLKKHWPREEIKGALDYVAGIYHKLEVEMARDNTLSIQLGNFPLIDTSIGWFHRTLLGKEPMQKFAKEFNEALTTLKLYQDQLNRVPEKTS